MSAYRILAVLASLTLAGAGVLLMRRAEAGLFGGLWELPSIELGTESPDKAIAAFSRSLLGGRRQPERIGAVAQALR